MKPPEPRDVPLERRLGLFDATMIVMGGIIGSGIFINPYIVARQLPSSWLILLAWLCGGLIVLAGAMVYAELAARLPEVGGQYAYLREAWHPAIAFLYGWTLLLVIQSGGMAAVAITFARYFIELTGVRGPDWGIAIAALLVLTLINCLGVRAGSTTQNVLMLLKIGAIAVLVVAGFAMAGQSRLVAEGSGEVAQSRSILFAFGAAMTPIMFSYGGWQTASFVSSEMKNPTRDLARGVILGMAGVVVVYLSVNLVLLHVLGADGLAESTTPASAVMRQVLGEPGARFIALGIAISTLGFLSQSMLTAPRVYFAMARDGVFPSRVATVHKRTHVPVVAIALQGSLAAIIALSGTYEKILGYVVSADFLFFGLTALALFRLRKTTDSSAAGTFRTPLHPWTTLLFVAASWLVVVVTFVAAPRESLIGFVIIASGLPVYYGWRRRTVTEVQ